MRDTGAKSALLLYCYGMGERESGALISEQSFASCTFFSGQNRRLGVSENLFLKRQICSTLTLLFIGFCTRTNLCDFKIFFLFFRVSSLRSLYSCVREDFLLSPPVFSSPITRGECRLGNLRRDSAKTSKIYLKNYKIFSILFHSVAVELCCLIMQIWP